MAPAVSGDGQPMDGNPPFRISGETVRADFNAPESVRHYARATGKVGLWNSERLLLARHFPDAAAPLLEAGCGTGRVTLALAAEGYADLTGFDFAEGLLGAARHLAAERGVAGVAFHHADATALDACPDLAGRSFAGVLFLFNGLMQIPGRERRRAALRGLHALARPGAPLLLTTHDRDDEPGERRHWARQAQIWARGEQDPSLLEFGDRYFVDDDGYRVFMHLPDRKEILEDLAATGWTHVWDEMRRRVSPEPKAVRDFSDECRFWVARRS
jgi:SAM-dependent methyltransferase